MDYCSCPILANWNFPLDCQITFSQKQGIDSWSVAAAALSVELIAELALLLLVFLLWESFPEASIGPHPISLRQPLGEKKLCLFSFDHSFQFLSVQKVCKNINWSNEKSPSANRLRIKMTMVYSWVWPSPKLLLSSALVCRVLAVGQPGSIIPCREPARATIRPGWLPFSPVTA